MPILFSKSFKASDGKCYGTLKEAQVVELTKILGGSDSIQHDEQYARRILETSDLIMDVLTLKENSIPKARSINGGRKPRAPKPKVVADPDKCQTLPGV